MQPINSSNSSRENGNTKRSLKCVPKVKSQISPAKNWCFTLNNYLESDINEIIKVCSNSSTNYIFQEEMGENGTKHLQGYVEFNTKKRPMSVFDNKSIHWEKRKGTKQQNINYCSKSDTNNGKMYTNFRLPKPIKMVDKLYKWQETIKEILLQEPDDRTVYWIHEPSGNIGKSLFCKYMALKHGAIVLSGKANDMKYGIIQYKIKNDVYPEIILIDIPRNVNNFLSYTGIEEIKNGCFFSAKYECDMVIMNSPHIVCFSNEEPDYSSFSLDRWKIAKVEDKDSEIKWEKSPEDSFTSV